MKYIVYGNAQNPEERVKTHNAKWLRLDDIYQKFHRPNYFDIGGTYVTESVADYWFMYKTEQIGNIFLLHLFITSHQEATFALAISFNNNFKLDKRNSAVFLPVSLKEFYFTKTKEHSPNYVTTFSFTELDVDFFENKSLYIAVKFLMNSNKSIHQNIIDKVKYTHDFSALLTDPICSDFTIESAEGDRFNVNRVLLAAHSEVFKAMLKEDTAESQNSFVKLIDVSTDDLRFILEFIYSGTIRNFENCNLCSLLMLADQYNLSGLRELSQYVLSKQLSADNALETLVLADMYNSESLKIAAMKIVKGNSKIVKSSTFKEIKNADLLRELCEYLVPT